MVDGAGIPAGGRPIADDQLGTAGRPIAGGPGAPTSLAPGQFGEKGLSIQAPDLFRLGSPIGGPASIFNIGGAPITVLGGVFSGGLPLGGPVTQIFRGGSAPVPPTLFAATLTSAGPIANFFIGAGGAPIGTPTFGGGALPIGPTPEISQEIIAIGPRTALVGANPQIGLPPPAVAFGDAAPLAKTTGQRLPL